MFLFTVNSVYVIHLDHDMSKMHADVYINVSRAYFICTSLTHNHMHVQQTWRWHKLNLIQYTIIKLTHALHP